MLLSFSRMCLHDVLCHLTGPRGLYTLIKLTKGEPALDSINRLLSSLIKQIFMASAF